MTKEKDFIKLLKSKKSQYGITDRQAKYVEKKLTGQKIGFQVTEYEKEKIYNRVHQLCVDNGLGLELILQEHAKLIIQDFDRKVKLKAIELMYEVQGILGNTKNATPTNAIQNNFFGDLSEEQLQAEIDKLRGKKAETPVISVGAGEEERP